MQFWYKILEFIRWHFQGPSSVVLLPSVQVISCGSIAVHCECQCTHSDVMKAKHGLKIMGVYCYLRCGCGQPTFFGEVGTSKMIWLKANNRQCLWVSKFKHHWLLSWVIIWLCPLFWQPVLVQGIDFWEHIIGINTTSSHVTYDVKPYWSDRQSEVNWQLNPSQLLAWGHRKTSSLWYVNDEKVCLLFNSRCGSRMREFSILNLN